ncbi:hypothetical protein HMI54_004952 [Coelomomyces lativittatus]|nr:hypothetical protein HMI54_004952 [Coelomomyces lativittatus]KAJ1508869.1 hypothetical protein HMI56_007071 [Coelomomyces lativittatus]KAJ1513125.1 hypothetical protein HMI55_005883 [Coelomomyces lativittatus]
MATTTTTPLSSELQDILHTARQASLQLRHENHATRVQWIQRLKQTYLANMDELARHNQRDLQGFGGSRSRDTSLMSTNETEVEVEVDEDEDVMKRVKWSRLDLMGPKREESPSIQQGSSTSSSYVKFTKLMQGMDQVCALPDPLNQVTLATALDHGLHLYRCTCALGVMLVIFESRPEVYLQLLSLALKSGNVLLLKGGQEAYHTLTYLHSLTTSILPIHGLVQLLSHRDQVHALLTYRPSSSMARSLPPLDVCIARGSKHLIHALQNLPTQVPLWAHAEGVCHIYLHADAPVKTSMDLVVDAKCSYPTACNAVETVLVHVDWCRKTLESERSSSFSCVVSDDDNDDEDEEEEEKKRDPSTDPQNALNQLVQALIQHHVCVYLDPQYFAWLHVPTSSSSSSSSSSSFTDKKPMDWVRPLNRALHFGHEFQGFEVCVAVVQDMNEALHHIETYGSHHTEAIVTLSPPTAHVFLQTVDSACVFWNCSTRFSDGYRFGFGAEVGISTQRLHARGPVGLDGLVTYKYLLHGQHHCVQPYMEGGPQSFVHAPLPLKYPDMNDFQPTSS